MNNNPEKKTLESRRFSQPVGTCKSRSRLAEAAFEQEPSKSLVMRTVVGSFKRFSSLWALSMRSRELTSAAMGHKPMERECNHLIQMPNRYCNYQFQTITRCNSNIYIYI